MVGFVTSPVMALSTSTSSTGLPSDTILRNARNMLAVKEQRVRDDMLQKKAEWAAKLATLRTPPNTSSEVFVADSYVRWDIRLNSISQRFSTPQSLAAIEDFISKTPQRPTRGDPAAAYSPSDVSGDGSTEEEEKTGGLAGIAKALGLK